MKSLLRASAAMAVTLVAAPAFAADKAPATSDQPAEIIVTAQKRAEPLQKVPVAVSVISGDSMARFSTNNIEDSQRFVPALTFVKGDTNLNSALFLRGIGTVSFSIAAEPSVTSVLDGVVLARAGESFGDMYDVERVEVLRGPQGTLFGKNASAGVINVVTKEPGKQFGGYVDLGYFEGNEFKAKASLGGPIGSGWRAGVTGFYSRYDGNITDTAVNTKINGYKHYGARGQLIGDVGSLHLRATADYRKGDDVCCSFVVGALNPSPSAAQLQVESVLGPALGGGTRVSVQAMPNRTVDETWGASLQADLALGGHTLTSITAYRKWNNEEVRDGDWVNQVYRTVPLIRDDGPQTSNTFTQELRLTSPVGGFVDYVLGAFYYRAAAERTYTRSDTYCTASTAAALPSGLVPCPAGSSTLANPVGSAQFGSVFTNYAAYGQATWHLAPRFRAVTGLRYTHDKVTGHHVRTDNFTGTAFPGVGGPAGIGASFDANVAAAQVTNGAGFTGTPWTGQTSADNLSGKVALEVDLAAHNMAYASYSRGYKGPAFNIFFNMQWFNTAPIAPETSDSFEAGLKNSFANGKVLVNIDAFYAKVHNYQANYPTTVNGAVTTTIINAGEVSTRGFESELLFRPTRNFTLNAAFSYTNAHVDAFLPPPAAQAGNAVAPGTPLAFAPKLKGSLGATWTLDSQSMPFKVELSGQGTFVDKQVSTLQATNTLAQVIAFQQQTVAPYDQVDLSLAAVDRDGRYRVAVVLKNALNQHYASTIITGGPGGSYLYQIPRDSDRYWGITGRFNF